MSAKSHSAQHHDPEQNKPLSEFVSYLYEIEELISKHMKSIKGKSDTTTLSAMCEYYGEMSTNFDNYRRSRRSKYYNVIKCSKDWEDLALEISDASYAVAEIFEVESSKLPYMKTHRALNEVLIPVSNLICLCEAELELGSSI